MNGVQDNKVVVTGFNGLFDRGISDACPRDHLTTCNNAVFPGASQVKTREGTEVTHSPPEPIVAFFQAVLPTRTFLLCLSTTGKLYDGASVLVTWAGANGFSAINLYNRVYLCPTFNGQPLSGGWVYYYDGINFTKAAGAAPLTAPTATHVGAGMVEIGLHKIAVAYVTRTGYITGYGPSVTDNSPGGKRIELSAIPLGPYSGVVGRRILATKANEEEFFFVPGGEINDNTTTSLNIDFLDTDLVVSADYLADLLPEIHAGAALRFYKSRLAVVGSLLGNRRCVYFSRVQDPESVSSVDGMATFPVNPLITPLTSGWELRDVFYVGTYAGVWSVQDNGSEPSKWPISVVDSAFGCYDNGVSAAFSTDPARDEMDMVLVADKTGLFMFDGLFRLPPLSWKIDDIWQSIAYSYFWQMSIAHDVWHKRVFINAPIGVYSATGPNCILMMDYGEGLSAEKVKWSIWTLPIAPTHIGMANPEPDATYILRVATKDLATIVGVVADALHDFDGSPIDFSITLAPIAMKEGWLSVYTAIRLRMLGVGKMSMQVSGEDSVSSTPTLGFTVSDAPGKEFFRLINFTNEKLELNISVDLYPVGNWLLVNRVEIFGVPRWMTRPVIPGS